MPRKRKEGEPPNITTVVRKQDALDAIADNMVSADIRPLSTEKYDELATKIDAEMGRDEGNRFAVRRSLALGDDIIDDLDEFHPAKDQYNIEMSRLMTKLDRAVRNLKFPERECVKFLSAGLTMEETIKRGKGKITSQMVKSKKIKRIVDLMASIYMLKRGVSGSQRVHMLWRIATRNEITRPDIAIASISAMGKIIGDTGKNSNSGKDKVIKIVVQNQALLDSPLDKVVEVDAN